MNSWVLYIGFLIVFLLGIMLGIILMLDEIKINPSAQESELEFNKFIIGMLLTITIAIYGYCSGRYRDNYYKNLIPFFNHLYLKKKRIVQSRPTKHFSTQSCLLPLTRHLLTSLFPIWRMEQHLKLSESTSKSLQKRLPRRNLMRPVLRR